jgi:general stress protein YciG
MANNGQQDQKDQPGSEPKGVVEGQQQGQPQSGQPPLQSQGQGQPQAQGMDSRRPHGARGTAAMDPSTRKEVARKGGMAVSRNRQHMAEIGRKGGQSVSKNREHMAKIGRKGGAASRGHH